MAVPSDTIQEAFDKALLNFKNGLKDESLYTEILQTTSIEQVYDATDRLQEEQAKKGHLRYLSKIEPYLVRLKDYAGAIEVFVQVKPDILALIWGPIKLLLQWASVLKTSFDAIINTTATIGSALPDFKKAISLFGQNNVIKDILVLFFKDILDFYGVALKFFHQPRWRYVFEALWPKCRDNIKVVATNIERHSLLMRKEVNFEHILQEYEARQRALQHFEKTEISNQKQEYLGIKADIAPETYRLKDDVCQGTGKWLMRNAIFKKWLDFQDKSTRLLWLQGIPGAGKTYLASTVVRECQLLNRTVFAFLNYRFSGSISILSIIHSLIFQLTADELNLQAIICTSSPENLKADTDIAIRVLKTLLACNPQVYIILDGLDEIGEGERCRVLKCLIDLQKDCEEIKVLISSRPEADLRRTLDDVATPIRVDNHNTESIQVFVKQWIQSWFETHAFFPDARSALEGWLTPLSGKSNGMFLYVKVILNSIQYLDDLDEIENEIGILPETLDDAYSRILSRVNNLDQHRRERARKLLGWVAWSPKPLTLYEVQHALSIKRGDSEGKRKVIKILDVVELCGPIVEVVDDYVQLVHFTAKEYITSPQIVGSIRNWDAIFSITSACLAYLCQRHHEPNLTSEEVDDYALSGAYTLHEFAATTWLELVEECVELTSKESVPPDLIKLLEVLFADRTNYWYEAQSEDIPRFTLRSFKEEWPHFHEMLQKASRFRHDGSTSQHKIAKGSVWINLDPLTVSQTTIAIHEAIESLLDCKEVQHTHPNCHCSIIRMNYGSRPFKCSFLHCPFRRDGFATKTERSSHERNHDRPWKCSVPTCEYVNGGFLSRTMRDEHLDRYHQEIALERLSSITQSSEDEIKPLLLDLVMANDVEAVDALISSINTLENLDKINIWGLAAAQNAVTMLQLMYTSHSLSINVKGKIKYRAEGEIPGAVWFRTKIIRPAVENNATEAFTYLLTLYKRVPNMQLFNELILEDIVKVGSIELLEIYNSITYNDSLKYERPNHEKQGYDASDFTSTSIYKSTAGDPDREQLVLQCWKTHGILEALGKKYLGDALVNLTKSTCSVRFAEYLINAGVDVNHRRSPKFYTPLHHAAKNTGQAAAELMKFLLQHGANPNLGLETRAHTRIRDEEGAQGISKWLGVSWDELVSQTRGCRESTDESGMIDLLEQDEEQE